MTLKLFIADDEPAFRRLVARVAREHRWDVVECGNGQELVSALEADHTPGLIMIDMMMPEMDGVETIWHLQEMAVRLPICFVTGGPAVQAMAARLIGEARELNVIDTLTKPLSVGDLSRLLNRIDPLS